MLKIIEGTDGNQVVFNDSRKVIFGVIYTKGQEKGRFFSHGPAGYTLSSADLRQIAKECDKISKS